MRRVRVPNTPLPGSSAFDGTRKLRMVLDERLPEDEDVAFLAGFASHELIEMYSASPRDDLLPIAIGDYHLGSDSLPYRAGAARQALTSAGQWDELAERFAELSHGGRSELHRLFVLTQIAANVGADIFVTREPAILEGVPRGLVEQTNPMAPEEATAVMGLYLRLRGDFTMLKGPSCEETLNRGLFYWLLTRSLLSSGWRWFGACVASDTATGTDTMTYLGQSTLRRFDRALRARDRMLQQFQLPANNDTSDEALFYLDVSLLMLNGAFDATARIAHRAYQLGDDEWGAGWRKDQWRKRLIAADQTFDALLGEQSCARDVMDLVGLLRNTIHGAALQGIAYEENPTSRENLVRVPAAQHDRLLAAIRRQGGDQVWGVRPMATDLVTLDADTFLERLLPASATTLDALMDATDVGRLKGVDIQTVQSRPPDDDDLFSAETARMIRALAGI